MPYKNKEDRAAFANRYRLRKKYRVLAYLAMHPCMDCGEKDPIVLEFDHRPRVNKLFEIGRAVTSSLMSWKSVMKEIRKCDVVCANCHRRRTAARSKHYRVTCAHSSVD